MNNTLAYFTAKAAQLPSGENSRLQTITISGGDRYGVQFTSGGSQQVMWVVPRIPPNYQGGTLKIDVDCIMASATSGNVVLTAAVEAITPADSLNLNTTNSFDTANSSGNISVPGTAGYLFVSTITLTLADSVAVGDHFRIKLIRTTDTATGDLIVLGATLYEEITNAKGDLFVASSNTTIANVPVGSNNYVLTADSAQSSGVKWASPTKLPTIQKFTSGSGTYTTPTGCTWIRVRMIGGGSGGVGSGTTGGTAPTAGGSTTFGSTLLVCNGGGASGWQGAGGAGGTVSNTSGPIMITANTGGRGGAYMYAAVNNIYCIGGMGAATPFGGGGANLTGSTGYDAIANTGGGGGGAGGGLSASGTWGGAGGGAGGYIEAIITSPSSTYAYVVGAGGAGGGAGTSGFAGGAGASGIIIVEEYYS